jgi:hypothetical protein
MVMIWSLFNSEKKDNLCEYQAKTFFSQSLAFYEPLKPGQMTAELFLIHQKIT